MANFERNITGAQAVTDLMRQMGITPPTSVFDTQDATARQLWYLATRAGQRLLTEHDWQAMSAEYEITTTPGQPNYPLPEDYDRFITDAQWNRTTRLPAIGSLREYEWQMLKARNLAGTTFTMLFRVEQNQVTFYETPSTAQLIVFPYVTRAWVRAADETMRDNLQADDDLVLYDSQLFKAKLELDFRRDKGFDVTLQQQTFDELLETAIGRDSPGRTLSLAQRSTYPYLGVINIPDTGYGSS